MFNSAKKKEFQNTKRELALARELLQRTERERDDLNKLLKKTTELHQGQVTRANQLDQRLTYKAKEQEKSLATIQRLEKKVSDLESDLEAQYAVNNKLAGMRDNLKEQLTQFLELLNA